VDPVCQVDADVRPCVDDDGQLGCGDVERGDPAHGLRGRLAGEEDRRLAALVGEDLGLVDAAARASGGDVLGSQGGVQFPECPWYQARAWATYTTGG
jgi:hypothetical protein